MQLSLAASLCALLALAGCSDASSTDPTTGTGSAPTTDAVAGGDVSAMDDADPGASLDADVMAPPSDAALGEEDADSVVDADSQSAPVSDIAADVGSDAGSDMDAAALVDTDTAQDVEADSAAALDVDATAPSGDAPTGEQDVEVQDFSDIPDAIASVDAPVEEEDVDIPPPAPLYLLSVNNSTHTLEKIDVATGAGTDICQLSTAYQYPSLTFSRDNGLYASRSGNTLDAIDPCTCEVTPVGPYNGFTGVNGITSDQGQNLFGVSHIQDELITIDTTSGAGTSVGPLGVNFGYTGATWAEGEQTVYAIDATSDSLFVISPETGAATLVAPLSQPMGTVGIEMHPMNGLLYACSDPAHLLEIDIATGVVTDLGDMGQNTACNNLAAPWKSVPCLE